MFLVRKYLANIHWQLVVQSKVMFIIVAFMSKVELCIFFRNSYVIDVFFIKINKFRSSLLRNRKQLNSPD